MKNSKGQALTFTHLLSCVVCAVTTMLTLYLDGESNQCYICAACQDTGDAEVHLLRVVICNGDIESVDDQGLNWRSDDAARIEHGSSGSDRLVNVQVVKDRGWLSCCLLSIFFLIVVHPSLS